MVRGQKETARKIMYKAFDVLEKKHKKDPLEIFERALENSAPILEVRPKRVGGATYQVPVEVKGERRQSLAFRWIIASVRKKKGRSAGEKLAEELLAASNNEGEAVKKRETTHKMAEANRAFAHFAR
jgi:small subunit ribosomal protein S7